MVWGEITGARAPSANGRGGSENGCAMMHSPWTIGRDDHSTRRGVRQRRFRTCIAGFRRPVKRVDRERYLLRQPCYNFNDTANRAKFQRSRRPQAPARKGEIMKNPLDSIWGTIVCG